MSMKWALLVIVSGGILLFSCKKDKSADNGSSCSKTLAGLSGSYKLIAAQYRSSATATPVDYYAQMEACEKDDILTLKSDGTYQYSDAGTPCTDQATDHGTWQVSGNTLTSDGVLHGTIGSYDCKTLVYYIDNALTIGDRITFTMVRQ